jgi:hypothetical protein
MMDDHHAQDTGRLALAIGAVAAGSAACLAGLFTVGQPFGTLNDLGNATVAILSGGLAWRMRGRIPGRTGDLAVSAAVVGAGVATAGSALVVSGTTSWFLAGLVSSLGFAGIGAWLVVANRRGMDEAAWPRSLRLLGMTAGALMALGVAAVPGIALRLDNEATAPAWAWIAMMSWLGIYLVYPAWAIRLGLLAARRGTDVGPLATRAAAD